jgi:hypothetical protein
VTDMNNMFKGAAAFYQDITGWTTTSLIYSTDMFTDAGAWLNRLERDGTTSTDGPSNVWVHKPCLRDERAQSGWCVPCEPNFIHIEGYDPAVGDTTCDEMTCCQAKMKRSSTSNLRRCAWSARRREGIPSAPQTASTSWTPFLAALQAAFPAQGQRT